MHVDYTTASPATTASATPTADARRAGRRSRPVVEGLETRQVLSGVTANQVAVADQVIAAYFAKPLVSAYVQIADHYGNATAGNTIGRLLSTSNLDSFLRREGGSAIANFPGGTAQLQYDMLYDMLYLTTHAGGHTISTSVVNPTTAASSVSASEAGLSSSNNLLHLASYSWGGDSDLQTAGLGVVGD